MRIFSSHAVLSFSTASRLDCSSSDFFFLASSISFNLASLLSASASFSSFAKVSAFSFSCRAFRSSSNCWLPLSMSSSFAFCFICISWQYCSTMRIFSMISLDRLAVFSFSVMASRSVRSACSCSSSRAFWCSFSCELASASLYCWKCSRMTSPCSWLGVSPSFRSLFFFSTFLTCSRVEWETWLPFRAMVNALVFFSMSSAKAFPAASEMWLLFILRHVMPEFIARATPRATVPRSEIRVVASSSWVRVLLFSRVWARAHAPSSRILLADRLRKRTPILGSSAWHRPTAPSSEMPLSVRSKCVSVLFTARVSARMSAPSFPTEVLARFSVVSAWSSRRARNKGMTPLGLSLGLPCSRSACRVEGVPVAVFAMIASARASAAAGCRSLSWRSRYSSVALSLRLPAMAMAAGVPIAALPSFRVVRVLLCATSLANV
mmetsp:Transcript_132076/g.228952  ORF Transcript_132076/g.228952 Transcript_132076/m.228952 type:complete len:435 (-) Transcript_132076:669-1973(-)